MITTKNINVKDLDVGHIVKLRNGKLYKVTFDKKCSDSISFIGESFDDTFKEKVSNYDYCKRNTSDPGLDIVEIYEYSVNNTLYEYYSTSIDQLLLDSNLIWSRKSIKVNSLSTGDIVMLRDYNKYKVVVKGEECVLCSKSIDDFRVDVYSDYNEDLTHKSDYTKDIIRVYKPTVMRAIFSYDTDAFSMFETIDLY